MIAAIFIGALVIGALVHFAGFGRQLHQATEFLSKWVARALIVILGVGVWYLGTHYW